MTCRHAQIISQHSLDQTLPAAERRALLAHLEVCASCRRERDAQRRLARLTDRWAARTLEASDPGDEFTAQVLSRLEARLAPSRLQVLLPLAAALFLLAALTLVPSLQAFRLPAQTLTGLPDWLRVNLAALPGDALAVLRLPPPAWMPAWATAWTTLLLLGVFLLNAGFCVHARQRSAS